MGQAQRIPHYTLTEYLVLERATDVRHEYLDGLLVAMGGASRRHNRLVLNLGAALLTHLEGTPCRVDANDLKVAVAAVNRVYYPDLVVSCSNLEDEIDDYTESPPCLIAEVLSPSTEILDRTEKRVNYQRLESLEDYVLIAQDKSIVERYSRTTDGWIRSIYHGDESILLPSIDFELPVKTLYAGVASLSKGL